MIYSQYIRIFGTRNENMGLPLLSVKFYNNNGK